MSDDNWLGGYSLEQLLGVASVTEPAGPSAIARIAGAPFRLVGALVALPFRLLAMLVKAPFRLLKAVLPPYGRRAGSTAAR